MAITSTTSTLVCRKCRPWMSSTNLRSIVQWWSWTDYRSYRDHENWENATQFGRIYQWRNETNQHSILVYIHWVDIRIVDVHQVAPWWPFLFIPCIVCTYAPLLRSIRSLKLCTMGPVYLAEMLQLPQPVLIEFQRGNFVVKRSKMKFNQVDPDQAQEWFNCTGKTGSEIVGLTKTPRGLSRWEWSIWHSISNLCDTKLTYVSK